MPTNGPPTFQEGHQSAGGHCYPGCRVIKASVEADQAPSRGQLIFYTRIISPIDGLAGFANNQSRDLVSGIQPLADNGSEIDPIKASNCWRERIHRFLFALPDTVHVMPAQRIEFRLDSRDASLSRKRNFTAGSNLDPKTGSIHYYVRFPNPDAILRPGQYGKGWVRPERCENAAVFHRSGTELQVISSRVSIKNT